MMTPWSVTRHFSSIHSDTKGQSSSSFNRQTGRQHTRIAILQYYFSSSGEKVDDVFATTRHSYSLLAVTGTRREKKSTVTPIHTSPTPNLPFAHRPRPMQMAPRPTCVLAWSTTGFSSTRCMGTRGVRPPLHSTPGSFSGQPSSSGTVEKIRGA